MYGARTLTPVLQKYHDDLEASFRTWPKGRSDYSGVNQMASRIDSFFARTWERFRTGWRPDVPRGKQLQQEAEQQKKQTGALTQRNTLNENGNTAASLTLLTSSISSTSSTSSSSSFSEQQHVSYSIEGGAVRLREHVEYALLLLRSEVTVPALLTLTQQILCDHWCLPVGEIGKLLQEATSNSGLSSTLKEKFGGLKRFLEKFPEVFLVSTDHRFNPLVYLRSALSPEQKELVKQGISLSTSEQTSKNGNGNGNVSGSNSDVGVNNNTGSNKRKLRRKRGTRRKKGGNGGGGNGGNGGNGGGGNQKNASAAAATVDTKLQDVTLKATATEFVPSF